MNIVDLVTSQLTGEVLGKLGGLIGANESQTKSATGAAVPALLSVLAKLSGTKGGADQLASALGGLDLKTLGSLAGMLGGGAGASGLGTIGGKLLTSLLGDNVGRLVGTIATFAGTNPAIMKTLLTYLAPIVMGVIAGQFKGAAIDASGLQRLFSEQQDNIRAALPKGLSLGDFDTSGSSPRRAEEHRAGRGHEEAASAFPSWLPLLLVPLVGIVGWWLWQKTQPAPRAIVVEETRRQEGPLVVDRTEVGEQVGQTVAAAVEETVEMSPGMAEALKLGEQLTGLLGGLGTVLGGVSDEESARAAIPKLEEFSPTIDSLMQATHGLPQEGRSTIVDLVSKNLDGLQKVVDAVMAIPGVKEILGPVVAPMVERIAKLGTE